MSQEFSTNRPGSLFWQGALVELMQDQSRKLCAEVDASDREAVLGSNLEEIANLLVQKYNLEPVKLHREETEIVTPVQSLAAFEAKTDESGAVALMTPTGEVVV